ncbi:polysaccharide lyase family 1 protein [Didymella exigua CBS 183.55]|uniref:Polysaccharide lyase family 1 protein n=1 Tax=Didymella exigua CBS 183.55 TaxID=1150837 RepID=A0A6A5RIE4_9PLEO|nr:polysaccharide lyase family 1 protein [Didymella exigua CBS 183.55]KAF1928115.1 polysaccharide lyase family 1 protein [Didymella exigua CBS 183.55]
MRFFEVATVLAAAGAVSAAPLEKRAAAVDELVGFAAGTTGGGSGAGTTVSDCAGLTAAAKIGGVIKIQGTLTGCGIVKILANTSVLGVGSTAGLTDGGLQIRKVDNVIVRNIKFFRAPAGKDLIDIDQATRVWIDHNDFSSVGITGDKDTYDGLLDAKHGADSLTFSWNKFHDHWKGSLVGHSDSNSAEDTGKLHVTYHHNDWTNVNSRLPSVRFGTAHIYSSCYNGGISGVNSRMGAQVLVENTSFTGVTRAIVTNLDSKVEGFANERNNLFTSSTTQITQVGTWTPSYAYTADAAADACSIVAQSAGVGVVTF